MSEEAVQAIEDIAQDQDQIPEAEELTPEDQSAEELQKEQENAEDEAKKYGWDPTFTGRRGRPALTAQEYLDRYDQTAPAIKHVRNEMLGTIEAQKAEMARLRSEAEELKQYKQQIFEIQTERYDQKLEVLNRMQFDAAAEGDRDAWTKIEDEKQKIYEKKISATAQPKVAPPAQAQNQQATLDSAAQDFVSRNPWINEQDLNATAMQLAPQIMADGYTQGKAFFGELERRVKEARPERFENQQRNRVQATTDASRPVKPSSKSFENLPPSAKTVANQFADRVATRFFGGDRDKAIKEYTKQYYE